MATEAESFLSSAKNIGTWLYKANSLFLSAETLYNESAKLWLDNGTDTLEGHNTRIQTSMSLLQSSQLLYGYAMETLLKAILIAVKPETVEFDLKSDGAGNILEAKISQIGVPMSKGHDLSSLANAVGLIENSTSPKKTKRTLDYLTECVQWRARYPTPQHSKKHTTLGSDDVSTYMFHQFHSLFVPIYDAAVNLLENELEKIEQSETETET
ncbi:hypothetical protein [Vibrio diabolicus]|uniref:hypothetical protein n=1 Tax=Vibrio diabolicus TaxID=50719 RepID=UPI003D7D5F2C